MSDRGNTLKRLDRLWFQILKYERGQRDQLSGRPANGLGTFHILGKGGHPRLRYSRENCLLVNWMPDHYNWHHYTANDHQYKFVEKRIKDLRGDDYNDKLLILEKTMPCQDLTYLKTLELAFKQELKTYEH